MRRSEWVSIARRRGRAAPRFRNACDMSPPLRSSDTTGGACNNDNLIILFRLAWKSVRDEDGQKKNECERRAACRPVIACEGLLRETRTYLPMYLPILYV